ncbi:MAG: alpha/beta hydrolase fold domain-containing protein [Bryobacteraceae bacterium]
MRKLTLLCVTLALVCFGATDPKLPESVKVHANISYDQYPETVLDIYEPKAPAMGKRPGVLIIHGGGWRGGTKESVVEKFVIPWVEEGFVVANVEYRLAKAATAPAAVTDVLKAAEWFRKNAGDWGVDRKRIVVTGGSAGGHLSLMVGMTPKSAKLGPTSRVAAVVNFYGITDVQDQLQGPNMREYAVTWIPEQDGRFDLARRVSPVTYVRKDLPAILTIHGTVDETVPYEHGVNLTKALRDAGADAEMISVPGGAHGFPMEKMNDLYDEIFDFLRKREILK